MKEKNFLDELLTEKEVNNENKVQTKYTCMSHILCCYKFMVQLHVTTQLAQNCLT
jgi:hypothetical protein